MKVILTKDHKDLGKKGEIVNVSNGFAFNNLIPNGMAMVATEQAIKKIEKQKVKEEKEKLEKLEIFKEEAKKLNKKKITIISRAEGDKLFGSVDKNQIAETIKEQHKIEITEEMIELVEPIKKLTTIEIPINFGNDIKAGVIVTIVSK